MFLLLLVSSAVLAVDTDNDGLPDAWEDSNGLNKYNYADADSDADNDGLTALEEFQYGTNPFSNDSDYDTLKDNWEIENKRNPAVADYLISTNLLSACAKDDTGVVCWGNNDNGQLDVPSLTNLTQLSVGFYHSCAP